MLRIKRHIKNLAFVCAMGLFTISLPQESQAQCPMCRMSAETNLENGGTAGKGLNTGILYMLAMPYLLVGTLGFIWWRNRRIGVDDEVAGD